MTRVNTLKDIEKIYEATTMKETFGEVLQENTVVKTKMPKVNKGFEEEAKSATSPVKGTGPESSEGYEKKVVESGGTGERDDKNHYSAGKVAKESINISKEGKQSMGNEKKSIFDKLYEDVLGGDEDMGGFEDLGAEDDLGGEEDFGDEEGLDEVTLSLPRDLAEALLDALSNQLGGDEDIEDIEDIEGEDDFGGEEEPEDDMPFQEAPDVEIIGHALQGDIDRGNLKGKSNKVSGSGPAHSAGGGGDGDGKLKGGKPEPTDLGDKSGTLTGKNNKVGGTVKGKDQELFGG